MDPTLGPGDLLNNDIIPLNLGELVESTEPGQSHIPVLEDSPVINGGANSICTAQDQLGQDRNGICDVGAVEAGCGDGIIHSVRLNEECDDGNTDDGDGCTATCVLEFCGDGLINDSTEVCDGTELGGATCIAEGFDGGTLVCTNCQLDTDGCTTDTSTDTTTDTSTDTTTDSSSSGTASAGAGCSLIAR